MNIASIFFYFGLPVLIAAGGWAVVLLNDRNNRNRNRHHQHPAE